MHDFGFEDAVELIDGLAYDKMGTVACSGVHKQVQYERLACAWLL